MAMTYQVHEVTSKSEIQCWSGLRSQAKLFIRVRVEAYSTVCLTGATVLEMVAYTVLATHRGHRPSDLEAYPHRNIFSNL